MPCFDSEGDSPAPETDTTLIVVRDRLNTVTAMLCGLMTQMEDFGVLRERKASDNSHHTYLLRANGHLTYELDGDLAAWWTAHKRMDEARKVSEEHERRKARKAAWDKLTDKDLELMGLTRPQHD